VPEFQLLPSPSSNVHATRKENQQLPHVEDAMNMPQVDLKGHTVEELAAAANVSVEVIKTAIKMRQQQMLAERRSDLLKQQVMNQSTSTFLTTPVTSTITKTTSTTVKTTTSRPSTTLFVSKQKVKKHPMIGGNKVSADQMFDDNKFFVNESFRFPPGHERAKGILSNWL